METPRNRCTHPMPIADRVIHSKWQKWVCRLTANEFKYLDLMLLEDKPLSYWDFINHFSVRPNNVHKICKRMLNVGLIEYTVKPATHLEVSRTTMVPTDLGRELYREADEMLLGLPCEEESPSMINDISRTAGDTIDIVTEPYRSYAF